jgi:uncharacterized membrane protein YjgN (DUF898 family)
MELINEPQSLPNEKRENTIGFTGEGGNLLVIMLLNWVFTTFTLGLYYPWARVNTLRFMYGNTTLNNTPFIFHGTGKELFKGFVKFFAIVILIYGLYFYAIVINDFTLLMIAGLALIVFVIAIIPLALHGAFRYRLSRTSWSGIHLGYRGERGQLAFEFFTGIFLSIITFGIYYSWFINRMRTYVLNNCRFGSLKFGYDGSGTELFIINLKGYFFSFLTLGIYYFWYKKEYLNYFADFTYIEQNGKKFHLKGKIRGGSFFALTIINLFLTIFTFGLGIPWVIVRTAKFMINNIEIPAQIDFENIEQTEDEFLDATGEDVLDYFDLGLI